MYLIKGVRSTMESFFVKFQVFPTKKNTVDNYFAMKQLRHTFT